MEKHGLSPEEIKAKMNKAAMDKHGLSPEEIRSKMKKYEDENKDKPSNPMKPRVEEKPTERDITISKQNLEKQPLLIIVKKLRSRPKLIQKNKLKGTTQPLVLFLVMAFIN
jgi:hypothetical protein